MKKVRTIENDQGQKEARRLAVDASVGFAMDTLTRLSDA